MALRLFRVANSVRIVSQVRCMSDSQQPGWGSGAGQGGGSGGTVREAGGSLGKREAALEEQYFRKLQQEQLSALKESVQDEIKYHEAEIKEHMEDIERHKKKLENLQKLEKH